MDKTNDYLARMQASGVSLRKIMNPKTLKEWLFVIKWSRFDKRSSLNLANEGEYYSKDAIKFMRMKLDLIALNHRFSDYNRQRLQYFLSLKDEK